MSDLGIIGNRDSVSAAELEPLLAGYRPLSGIFDEMMDRDGRVRAHWQPLLAMLARLGPQELSRRFAAADRHLHESGVFYRVYEDASGAERPWPLSHVPLLINASEWHTLKAGLTQRAELLEAVLADAYGPLAIGGCSATAPRHLRAQAMRSKIASRFRGQCLTFTARSKSSAWRRSSRRFRPSFPRSSGKMILASASSRRGR